MSYERGVVRFVLEFCYTFIHVNLYHYIFDRVLIIANQVFQVVLNFSRQACSY